MAFLRVVTRGNFELATQVEYCEIADYQLGICDIHVHQGPPSRMAGQKIFGPALRTGMPKTPLIETMLSIDNSGMLTSVEIRVIGAWIGADVLGLYVHASEKAPAQLKYHVHL